LAPPTLVRVSRIPHKLVAWVLGHHSGLEIDGGLFAAVLLDLVGDFLPFMETVEPGSLNRADMDEYVFAAAVRLNEAITLCAVEPLNRACGHAQSPSMSARVRFEDASGI
jgi:hypothetical protein